MSELREQAGKVKEAARALAILPTLRKNAILLAMAEALEKRQGEILEANAADIAAAESKGTSPAMLDRLALNEGRIHSMAEGLRKVAGLPDPVGEVIGGGTAASGLRITKRRVPLGVVGIIYEARPNVTSDAMGLCLKTGNGVILKGGSEAVASNAAIARIMTEAGISRGLPEDAVCFVSNTSRECVNEMMKMNGLIDVLIPRGGSGLIQAVVRGATVPVIETGVGNCHIFVDMSADLEMARKIVVNAKTSRPSVCNAAESLLVHREIAPAFLPDVFAALKEKGVRLYGCPESRKYGEISAATEEDYAKEYLDLAMSVKVVADVGEAVRHINRYGTQHSEAIVTRNIENARYFQEMVDAAAVYVNASTRFTDGEEFGLGAEIGISTQKLHARGPMGLTELTTYKYFVEGDGQIR